MDVPQIVLWVLLAFLLGYGVWQLVSGIRTRTTHEKLIVSRRNELQKLKEARAINPEAMAVLQTFVPFAEKLVAENEEHSRTIMRMNAYKIREGIVVILGVIAITAFLAASGVR